MNVQCSAQPTPIKIQRVTDAEDKGLGLVIAWSDGTEVEIPARTLRSACPCASCREKRGEGNHEKPLSAGRSRLTIIQSDPAEETVLVKVSAIGNYAINILWGDGHDSGIYSFNHLRAIIDEKPIC